MPDELKPLPCPWCGTQKRRDIIGKDFDGCFRVEHFCGFATILGREWFKTEQEAIDAWNCRVGEGEKG